MKKKIGLLLLASFAVFSLTSCADFLYSLIGGDTINQSSQNSGSSSQTNPSSSSSGEQSQDSGHSSSSGSGSSSSSSSSSSTPDVNPIEAKKANSTYMDYIENNVYPISSTPCVGSARILVIPVWFTDSSTFIKSSTNKANVKSDIETAYFGTNDATGWRSVRTYYEEESFQNLSITGTVSDWYECNYSYSRFTKDDDTSKTVSLIQEATDWYFRTHSSENRRNYDCDHDGYLDGVMVIYGAPDYGTWGRDSYDNLWAYCFWTQDYQSCNPNTPGVNAFFWASYDFMYGSNTVSKRAGSSYAGGDTTYCTLDAHTYIHEMGHMFGLDDYYDYSSNGYSPAGSFSMQDANVGGHDPFSSYALGWGKAYVPTESMTIELKPFATSGEMILLSPSYNSYKSPFDEYLLIEYYTPTGLNKFDTDHPYRSGYSYPTGSKQSGIRLWHVDARLAYTSTGTFSSSKITTNPSISNNWVTLAMTNTSNDKSIDEQYLSPLGSDFYNYNLLQMIRNSTSATYKAKDNMSSNTLFKAGDSFSMGTYGRQFVNTGKLDTNKDLGFTFTVDAINSNQATITINKL